MKNLYWGFIFINFFFVQDGLGQIKDNSDFYFIQMADPQFGMITANNSFEQESLNFTKAITIANRMKPAFIIVCGDLINQSINEDQIAEYKKIVSNLSPDIRIYNVAGNHDVGNIPTKKTLENYRYHFGKDYYSFKFQNFFGIVLNSSIIFNSSHVPMEAELQFRWLLEKLEEAKSKGYDQIGIFTHIPWFLDNPNEDNNYFNIPKEKRIAYLDLFAKYEVKYLFSGHLHYSKISEDKKRGLTSIVAGAIGNPFAGEDPSLRIMRVGTKEIIQNRFTLDSLIEN